MSTLDRLWRHPDRELRRVRREFWATPQRPERAVKPRRVRRRPMIRPVIAIVAAVMLYLGLSNAYPSLPAVALNQVSAYFTSFTNCDAAGAACEPSRR